ncbi:MAG: type III-A CRISPR-associated RAMP protein Csm4 [Thermodesulfobacteriota bacterium]
MQVYLYKLRFKGATHFGDTGIDLENVSEWVNSDTLFSAFVNALSARDGRNVATDFVNEFKERPPFLLSSLFVYKEDKYFLPRPLYDEHIQPDARRTIVKELKRLKWLTGEGFCNWTSDINLNSEKIQKIYASSEEYKESFIAEIRPRVSLDRNNQNSEIYHCGYVYFNRDSGLYGLVAFSDLKVVEFFKGLLHNLGEIGIGGEKTYGCGMFEVKEFNEVSGILKEILIQKAQMFTLLSLYHPSSDEMLVVEDNLVAYEAVRRRGWISSGRYALPFKRKSVGFITEGSVLKTRPKGCLVDVTPDEISPDMLEHRVYRYGYAFPAPFSQGE